MSIMLVRKSYGKRQQSDHQVHLIQKNNEKTECNILQDNEIRFVRTLDCFVRDSNICKDCADSVDIDIKQYIK